MTAAPAQDLIIAVLGAKGSAAPAVAEALSRAAESTDDGGVRLRVIVDAGPEDRPDAAVLVVDAVCPVRPDDVEVARGVASRVPMAVALAGRADTCTAAQLSETVDVTTRRLADSGVRVPVHLVDGDLPGAPAALLTALLSSLDSSPDPARGAPSVAVAARGRVPMAPDSDVSVVDWLLARRTEAITARSPALRQDVQALRMEVVQDLHRSLRDLGGRAREELAAAPRARVDALVRGLAADADAAVDGTIARAARRADALVTRHLGVNAPVSPRIPAPTSGIAPGRPPRNVGEELLVMVMGAAGGTGVGRMVLSPLAEIPGVGAFVLPLALVCGLVLGWTTVFVRRTQTLRTHTVSAVNERLAAVRAEAEQSLGARILAAESAITDGFAHDPGPRVADLERRIRVRRSGGTTHTTSTARTVAAPTGAASAAPAPTGSTTA